MLPTNTGSSLENSTHAGGQAEGENEAPHSAAGPGYAREWALFRDYAAATGQPALPTTVDALTGFLTHVPARPATQARRIAAIVAAHRNAGHLLARPTAAPGVESTPAGMRRPEPTPRPDPEEMIAACPTCGWPHGFVGRRDGFLIVLTAVLGYSHAQARHIRPTDLATSPDPAAAMRIRGRPLPITGDPRSCPACAAARWLEILGIADGLGRGSARMHLAAAQAPAHASPHHHTPAGPPRWREAAQLLPAIDRHGWIDDYHPLSTRSIHTRLALAAARADAPNPDAPRARPPEEPAPQDTARTARSLDEVLALLDQVAADADTANHRIEALLTDL